MTSGYKDGTPEEVRITIILPRKSFIFDANFVQLITQTLLGVYHEGGVLALASFVFEHAE